MDSVVWLESFRIAFRQMHRHRTRSILTMLGVIIGVAAIIMVVSISQGAKRRIKGQIAKVGSNMLLIIPGSTSAGGVHGGAGSADTLTLADCEAIKRECSAVSYASPATRIIAQAVSEYGNWTTPVTAINEDYLGARSWNVDSGRPIEARDVLSGAKVGLIGRSTCEKLFGDLDPVGQQIRLSGTPIEIVGLLSEKGQNPLGYDEDDAILVPISTAFRHLTGDQSVQALVASAGSEQEIPLAMNQIRTLLRHRHQLRNTEIDDFTVKSISEAAKTAEETSNTMTALLVSIAAISLLVGGIGIMNIMLVTVMERTREIGIRMAIGATRKMIMHQFVIEAAALAGLGGLIGVGLGLLGAAGFSRATGWPALVTAPLIIMPLFFAVAVGMVFGLLPAQRASRLNPVESLRHE